MSILIHGMKMPKGRPIRIEITADGAVSEIISPFLVIPSGYAIELPLHGRLIDADALMENAKLRIFAQSDLPYFKRFVNLLEFAPTIIPADPEGGENNG